jgi:outer membrane protein OmpA-like peptidoglycan-associated protein
VGEYHKKGWRWNETLWGNTDIYVCVKQGDFWSTPISLGSSVNTGAAERSPYLTPDGKKLYVASNGFRAGRFDLDIYEYRRVNGSDWTMWDGPYLVSELSSPGDDWFYRESNDGSTAYFSRSTPLPYKSSLPTRDGDGYIRETNFRTGYVVEGAQSAALSKDYQTDIYQVVRAQSPAIILPDLLFEFNADRISTKASSTLERLWDFIGQNTYSRIVIEGHTDNIGQPGYNKDLSTRRAESVGKFLLEQGLPAEKIKTLGFGDTQPRFDNNSKEGRDKNRRVEIRFE